MRMSGDISELVLNLKTNDGIGVVCHPGYFRPSGFKRILFYFSNPVIFLKDLKATCFMSKSLGAWENNIASEAYVKQSLRKNYVHGAIWFAHRKTFMDMCAVLAERIDLDFQRGLIAKWHDESHLNWYVANFKHQLFDNRLSWVEGYRQLRNLSESRLVTNVQKRLGEGREPTYV
jgi:hypothetical protein